MSASVTAPPALRARLAAELRAAAAERRTVVPLSSRWPELTLADAYAIQRELRAAALATGARLVGHKIGVTSEPIRRMFGIDHPDSGFVLDRMLLRDGAVVPAAKLIAPKLEGEIAFVLGDDLAGARVTRRHVLAATADVVPVLEVLDSRIRDWRIRLVDTVADNASSALAVVGDPVSPAGVALERETMVLEVDGARHMAKGSAVMGHPAESVAWLARTLHASGERLRAGQIVLAGAWTPAVPLRPGSVARATFAALGSVSLTVAPARSGPGGRGESERSSA